jgi:hypothetical protein
VIGALNAVRNYEIPIPYLHVPFLQQPSAHAVALLAASDDGVPVPRTPPSPALSHTYTREDRNTKQQKHIDRASKFVARGNLHRLLNSAAGNTALPYQGFSGFV